MKLELDEAVERRNKALVVRSRARVELSKAQARLVEAENNFRKADEHWDAMYAKWGAEQDTHSNVHFKKPTWAREQVVRENGLVEDVCKHGVGHPNEECLKKEFKNIEGMDVHGCDGCCIKKTKTIGPTCRSHGHCYTEDMFIRQKKKRMSCPGWFQQKEKTEEKKP